MPSLLAVSVVIAVPWFVAALEHTTPILSIAVQLRVPVWHNDGVTDDSHSESNAFPPSLDAGDQENGAFDDSGGTKRRGGKSWGKGGGKGGSREHGKDRTRERPAPKPLDAAALEQMALRYVERFATTRGRLTDYLMRKIRERGWDGGTGAALAEPGELAQRMADLGYVDDRAFAEQRAAAMQRRGLGARRVAGAFREAGIDEGDAESVAPAIADRAVRIGTRLRTTQAESAPTAPGTATENSTKNSSRRCCGRGTGSISHAKLLLHRRPTAPNRWISTEGRNGFIATATNRASKASRGVTMRNDTQQVLTCR
ncbi:regulatory protein RecX [Sphingomonas sp. H160509]|uniref:regulatory protein RecX n=1 Tax=Sphingomonas sp. H160509 TaxID=2955313 RepID=UPI003158CA57